MPLIEFELAFEMRLETLPEFVRCRRLVAIVQCPLTESSINFTLAHSLGVGNGAIVAPDASLGITYVVNATVDGSIGEYLPADTPKAGLFSQFLETSLPSPAVRGLVQEFAGYSLLNSTAFQVGQLWVGEGRNGKSVGLEIVSALHAKPVAMRLDNLTGFALQPLIGASLAVVSEALR